MRITDLLRPEGIALNAGAKDQNAALDQLVQLQNNSGNLTDPKAYKTALLAREDQGSTAIGGGVAVPHAKSSAVSRPGLAALTLREGADWGSPDGQKAQLLFAIAAPQEGGDDHLEILSRLMVLLMDEQFREKLLQARDKKTFLAVIDRAEREKYPENVPPDPAKSAQNGPKQPSVPPKNGEKAEVGTLKSGEMAPKSEGKAGENTPETGSNYHVVAVTACPTGIAHTYMAAEALEKAGRRLGISVKVETQGSGGAKNKLSSEEIASAHGVIIAADKKVELSRFAGKPLLSVPVSDGINKPESLLRQAAAGEGPICKAGGGRSAEGIAGEGAGRQVYKHLMNGVSHMLPFVIGGGILIALAFLADAGAVGEDNFADFGLITPLAAFLKNVGGLAFNFMLPILSGYIAQSIADRPGLAPGFVGGALAVSGATFASPAGTAVSAGFLGALLAGFLAGYVMLALEKLCEGLPRAVEGIKPVLIYPLAGIAAMGAVMCALNPLVGMLNTMVTGALESLSGTSAILLGAVVGGMMAIDMGGPFNKAAYLFGTASLVGAAGEAVASPIMAAVMVGGMVPPLAVALACTFFPGRFSEEERKNGLVNYIMGLCFITEGAIPFAAADPVRVIPACMAGSAVAGGLSMAFGCTLPAPHGGVFVFPVMGNMAMYILALVVGSVIGMALLGLLKSRESR